MSYTHTVQVGTGPTDLCLTHTRAVGTTAVAQTEDGSPVQVSLDFEGVVALYRWAELVIDSIRAEEDAAAGPDDGD